MILKIGKKYEKFEFFSYFELLFLFFFFFVKMIPGISTGNLYGVYVEIFKTKLGKKVLIYQSNV